MKTFRRILKVIAIIFAVVFVNGVYYVFCGQEKSVAKLDRGEELNLYECCSIYSMHCAAVSLSWIFCPEASDQCLLMMFAKNNSVHQRTIDYTKSDFIMSEIAKHNGQSFTLNFPLHEITSNKISTLRGELRFAVALDGARYKTYGPGNKWEKFELEVKYDDYIGYYTLGPIKLTFNWGLLKYIQDKGMLHKCIITYSV